LAPPTTAEVTTLTRPPRSPLPPAAADDTALLVAGRVEVTNVVGVGARTLVDAVDELPPKTFRLAPTRAPALLVRTAPTLAVRDAATGAAVGTTELTPPRALTLTPTRLPDPAVGSTPAVAVRTVDEAKPRPTFKQRRSAQVVAGAFAEVMTATGEIVLIVAADAPTPRTLALAPRIAPVPVVGRAPAVRVRIVEEPSPKPAFKHNKLVQVVAGAPADGSTATGEIVAVGVMDAPFVPNALTLAARIAPVPAVGRAPAVKVRIVAEPSPSPAFKQSRSVHVVAGAPADGITATGEIVAVGMTEAPLPKALILASRRAPVPAVGRAPAVNVRSVAEPKPRPAFRQRRSVHVVAGAAPEDGMTAIGETVAEGPLRPALRSTRGAEPPVGSAPAVTVRRVEGPAPRPRPTHKISVQGLEA